MKRSRFRYSYRNNASSLHKKVGDCIRNSTLFNKYQIYQEYPVVRVNPGYTDTSHHFDWVIPDLFLVIECHGEQHYTPVDFSGKQEDGGIMEYQRLKSRDRLKQNACIEAGWTYIELCPGDIASITDEKLHAAYLANKLEDRINEPMGPIQEETKADSYHERLLERARDYRKQQYQRAKARRKSMDSGE